MSDDLATRLRDRLDQASQHVDTLQSEYDEITSDPEVLQEDRDAAALLLEHARAELALATEAVERLENGRYGRCSRCDGEIGAERLAAIVDVTTCVNCAD